LHEVEDKTKVFSRCDFWEDCSRRIGQTLIIKKQKLMYHAQKKKIANERAISEKGN